MAHFVTLDSVDREILKPSILYVMLAESPGITLPITHAKLISVISEFKQGIRYRKFRKSILLYRKMEGLRVNPQNWETDKALFERLGFTQADLEDFRLFISMRKHRKMTYKEAYIAYMHEIDALK